MTGDKHSVRTWMVDVTKLPIGVSRVCPICHKPHSGAYGGRRASGLYCSYICTRRASTIFKRAEINKKISENCKRRIAEGKIITPVPKGSHQSEKHKASLRAAWATPETKMKQRAAGRKLWANR